MNSELCPRATIAPIGATFEEAVLPHLDAGRRLARWLVRNEHDAEDVVQEASLRAFRYFRTFTGGKRTRVVSQNRPQQLPWLARPGARDAMDPFDEQQHSTAQAPSDPETLLLQTDNVVLIERALGRLPSRYRELLVLRELQGLTYQELAVALNIPMGTVMSSLSRARQALRAALDDQLNQYSALARSNHETSITRS